MRSCSNLALLIVLSCLAGPSIAETELYTIQLYGEEVEVRTEPSRTFRSSIGITINFDSLIVNRTAEEHMLLRLIWGAKLERLRIAGRLATTQDVEEAIEIYRNRNLDDWEHRRKEENASYEVRKLALIRWHNGENPNDLYHEILKKSGVSEQFWRSNMRYFPTPESLSKFRKRREDDFSMEELRRKEKKHGMHRKEVEFYRVEEIYDELLTVSDDEVHRHLESFEPYDKSERSVQEMTKIARREVRTFKENELLYRWISEDVAKGLVTVEGMDSETLLGIVEKKLGLTSSPWAEYLEESIGR